MYIRRDGDFVVPSPGPASWDEFFDHAPLPSDDFMEERLQGEAQEREPLG